MHNDLKTAALLAGVWTLILGAALLATALPARAHDVPASRVEPAPAPRRADAPTPKREDTVQHPAPLESKPGPRQEHAQEHLPGKPANQTFRRQDGDKERDREREHGH